MCSSKRDTVGVGDQEVTAEVPGSQREEEREVFILDFVTRWFL